MGYPTEEEIAARHVKIVSPQAPHAFVLAKRADGDTQIVVQIRPNGSVEFGPGFVDNDQVARAFWAALGTAIAPTISICKDNDAEGCYWLRTPKALFNLGPQKEGAFKRALDEVLTK